MTARRSLVPANPVDALLHVYAINDGMNQLLLSHLEPRVWRAHPPGKKGSGRSIASIFAHVHNCRLIWLRQTAPHLKCSAPLDPDRCTMKQASAAHKKSAKQCLAMLIEALSRDPTSNGEQPRITKFNRGAWYPVWPADATMFAFMFAHEAHHRGQILLLAHQLGYRLPDEARGGIWWWDKLWKQLQ